MSESSLDRSIESLILDLPSDLPLPEKGCLVEVTALNGQQVCLARRADGELIAFESRCPHRGVPLCQGALEADQIICLEHFWRWQVASGEPLAAGQTPLRTYIVEDRGKSMRLKPS
jgi:nitrite reductase/ring-hydroxylating ferredoxin subunit